MGGGEDREGKLPVGGVDIFGEARSLAGTRSTRGP